LVLVAFDGTNNTSADNTNVWLFYKNYTGDRFYISGVGTQVNGRIPEKLFGAGWGYGMADRVEAAVKALENYFKQPGSDRDVDIVGFSRGAAIARAFANEVQPLLQEYDASIRFIGVWDTVPSAGVMHGEGGYDLDLPDELMGKAFHAMSIQENRAKFQLVRYDDATEVWFGGVHSDVGGGYTERVLADYSMHWMVYHARKLGVPEKLFTLPANSPDNVTVHNEMDPLNRIGDVPTALAMAIKLPSWSSPSPIQNPSVRREIKDGDSVHVSAIYSFVYMKETRKKALEREGREWLDQEFNLHFLNAQMNDDDDWIKIVLGL